MNVVLFSGSLLGLEILKSLDEIPSIRMAGVVTVPAQFKISYAGETPVQNVHHADFREACGKRGVPCLMMERGMSDASLKEAIASLKPDFFLVAGWYHMIPNSLRRLAPMGCAGLHASLLPKYRGGAPLVWAIICGETEAGVTLFHFGDGVDEGDIIGQERFPIREEDDIRSLYALMEQKSVSLVKTHLPLIASGQARRLPQDASLATLFPQRSPEDGRIDFSQSAVSLTNFIRAQTRPYPGAFFEQGGHRVQVWKARAVLHAPQAVASEVLEVEPDLVIKAGGEGAIAVERVGLGGTDMTGSDFARQAGIKKGGMLGT